MSVIPNPYNPLQPTDDPAYFYGREEVFAFFRQQLVGTAHDRALVLIGRRGLGKSAALRELRYRIDEHYVPCIVNLGTLDLSSEESLFAGLVEEIRQALDAAGASTYRLPEWPLPGLSGENSEPVNLRDWFQSAYLEVTLAALRIRHLLLIFDDAHLLLEAEDRGTLPGDELHYLAGVLATYDRLDLVFALDATYENRVLGIDLLNDPTLHFRLSELMRADAERLVREPVAGLLGYTDGVVDQILALAGGHPFLLHSICRLLFRRSEERHHAGPITENDLTAVYAAVIDQADEIFGPLWSSASPNERLILSTLVQLDDLQPGQAISFEAIHSGLASAGYTIHKTQLSAALRGLDYNGLIHAEADHYTLPVRLVTAWVKANAVAVPAEREPAPTRSDPARLLPLAGLLIVIVLVGILGIAVLGGRLLGGDDGDKNQPANSGASTATLSLNLEATRRADFMTQTEHARPTETSTVTKTPTATLTLTVTDTPTVTASSTPTLAPTETALPSPTRTPVPTHTPAPTDTRPAPATNTPRPTLTATLDPGG